VVVGEVVMVFVLVVAVGVEETIDPGKFPESPVLAPDATVRRKGWKTPGWWEMPRW
jgi:hypothetical protein